MEENKRSAGPVTRCATIPAQIRDLTAKYIDGGGDAADLHNPA